MNKKKVRLTRGKFSKEGLSKGKGGEEGKGKVTGHKGLGDSFTGNQVVERRLR